MKQDRGNIIISFILLCLAVAVMIIINYFTAPQFICDTKQLKTIYTEEISVEKMIELTNESRSEEGVIPLLVNKKLTESANKKAYDMFESQYFNHDSPKGITPWYWIEMSGYKYHYAGENLAMNFIESENVQNSLMKSIGHRKNILNEKFNEIGVAVKRGIMNEKETTLIVYHFGAK